MNTKNSKGYKLKPSTRKIICRIQEFICGDQGETNAKACMKYYSEPVLKSDSGKINNQLRNQILKKYKP